MGRISCPYELECGTSKSNINDVNVRITDLNNDICEKNDYKSFYNDNNFEKYIEKYPKTKIKVKVLGYVPISD